jgi:hypothetical protein
MSTDITLWDGGHAPQLSVWKDICDAVFEELGVAFEPNLITFRNGSAFNFVNEALDTKNPKTGAHVWVSFRRIDRDLCGLLFALAERARLFILVVDGPELLRPPSLKGERFESCGVKFGDVSSASALYEYFHPAQ